MSQDPRLRPREHGAYAMLAFPVASGLAMGGLSWAGAAFAVLALTGFLAHESVLIILGARGERIRSTQADHARRRLARLALVVVLTAVTFVVTASPGAWPPTALAGLLALSVGGLLLARKTKTLPGELLVAAAFASVHGVLAASGGLGSRGTYLPVVAWTASFAVATLSVHALKYRFKGRGPGRWAVAAAPVVAGILVVAGAVSLVEGHPLGGVAAALVPKGGVVLALSVLPANPRHLKRVGWSFVASDAVTLILLALFVR